MKTYSATHTVKQPQHLNVSKMGQAKVKNKIPALYYSFKFRVTRFSIVSLYKPDYGFFTPPNLPYSYETDKVPQI